MNRARSAARLILLATAAAAAWILWLPNVEPLRQRAPSTTAYIELRRRQAKAAGKKFHLAWQWAPDNEISEHLKQAVVMAEDDEFWRHDGVEWTAIRGAWERNWKEGRIAAGGSTITMQLARNLYLSPSKNPLRKAKEILIAKRLERVLGKRRILELYLNVVEWGKGIFGCEAAARAYFAKSCAELTYDEAVAMAVVLPNPRRWDPAERGVYVERNSRRIVERMAAAERRRAALSGELDVFIEPSVYLDSPAVSGFPVYIDSTTVNVSTGSVPIENGRNPLILE